MVIFHSYVSLPEGMVISTINHSEIGVTSAPTERDFVAGGLTLLVGIVF